MSLLNPLSRGTMRVENPLVEWSQTSRKAVRVVNPLLFRSQTSRAAVRVVNPLLLREMLDEPKAGRSNGRGLGKFLLGVVAVAVVAAGIMPLMEMLDEPSPAYNSHGNTEAPAEHQHHQTDKNNQEGDQHEESGGQEAGGSNGGDTGGEQERGDAGGQRSNNDNEDDDNDEEDDDNDEEDDDNDEEDSDSTSQSTISELVDSSSYDISDSTSQLSISEHRESSSDFSSESTLQLRTSEGEILIGLFNPRSINNKQSRISELPNRLNLSVLMLPETWVTPENGDQRLGEIKPGEFDVFHQPRVNQEGESERRGGGVAILSSNDLRGTRVRFENTSFGSFEFVAAELQHDRWDQPLWTVTVYRPPETEQEMRKFLEEFEKLLNQFSKDDSILITGDFNIWVNDKNNKHAKRFKKLLRNNGLRQHVREPTHNRGNTLDLVITRNVNISTLRVKKPKNKTKTVIDRKTKKEKKKNITLSDHSAVIFSVRPKNPTNPQSTQSNESEE